MAIKILVLKDDRLDTRSAYLKAKKFFSDNNIDVSFFQKEVAELVSVTEYSKRNGFDRLTGKPTVISNMGLDRIVIKNCQKYLRDNEYNTVIFSWDTDLLLQKLMSNEIVTSFVKENLFPNTGFIQLAINQYDIDKDNVWKKITHEILHEIAKQLINKGFKVTDEMDITTDGKPFYKNDDPYAIDGNYARTLSNIKPYLSVFNQLKYRYFSKAEAENMTPEFMEFADELRHRLGFALNENSGFRTPAENKKVGGVADSPHLYGKGKDWKMLDGVMKYKFTEEAQKLAKEKGKVIGIGIGDTFAHLDVGHRKVNTMWNYK